MAGKELANATYQITSGKAKFASQHSSSQREMMSHVLIFGHTMKTVKELEAKHPGGLHAQVVAGIQASRDGISGAVHLGISVDFGRLFSLAPAVLVSPGSR